MLQDCHFKRAQFFCCFILVFCDTSSACNSCQHSPLKTRIWILNRKRGFNFYRKHFYKKRLHILHISFSWIFIPRVLGGCYYFRYFVVKVNPKWQHFKRKYIINYFLHIHISNPHMFFNFSWVSNHQFKIIINTVTD